MSRRTAALVAALSCAFPLLFLGKAYSIDEPCFLAIARHILSDPFHPLAFGFNWYGVTLPMSQVNPNPPLVGYFVAAALKLGGGAEWATRLACLPFDALAGVSLYALASAFLRRPLIPVLLVLFSPAYALCVAPLDAEKWMAAFGFASLALLARALEGEEREPRAFWLSAAALALALLSKYSAVLFAVPALAYGRRRGVPARRLAAYALAAGLPAAAWLAATALAEPGTLASVLRHSGRSSQAWLGWSHQVRAFLAFAGGLGAVFFPACAQAQGRRRAALACAAAAAALFIPWLDVLPTPGLSRALGAVFAASALAALAGALGDGESRGAEVWRPWLAAAALLQVFVYWSVVARYVLFLMPPLIFAAAARLEREGRGPRVLAPAALAACVLVTLTLGVVDARYAEVQKETAAEAAAAASGGRLWYTGHWGLQEYMERAGAAGLDRGAGGWSALASGDVAVMPRTNSNVLYPDPETAKSLDGRRSAVPFALPVRLVEREAQAGFYSSLWGFLPYAPSRLPLDEHWTFRKR